MAGLTVDPLATVRGYVTLTFIGKGNKPARVPVPLPALPPVQAVIDGRTSGPLLRTRSGGGMDRRSVHRYVARTAQVAGISRPIGPHALRRTVGTVGLNQGEWRTPPWWTPLQRGQPAGVRCRRGHQHRRTRRVHGMHIQTSPAQIQPNVQHEDRASFRYAFRLSPQA
jgi:integrase